MRDSRETADKTTVERDPHTRLKGDASKERLEGDRGDKTTVEREQHVRLDGGAPNERLRRINSGCGTRRRCSEWDTLKEASQGDAVKLAERYEGTSMERTLGCTSLRGRFRLECTLVRNKWNKSRRENARTRGGKIASWECEDKIAQHPMESVENGTRGRRERERRRYPDLGKSEGRRVTAIVA